MLSIVVAAILAQAPVEGPWIDVSHGSNKILADISSRSLSRDRASVALTIQRQDGFRTVNRFAFDCTKNVYLTLGSQHTTESGEVIASGWNLRVNNWKPIDLGMAPILRFACSGDSGDRPLVSDIEEALGPQTY